MTGKLSEHFIVVRVKQTKEQDLARISPITVMRQLIHDVAEEREYNVSDILYREDRNHDYFGRSIRSEYLYVRRGFEKAHREIVSIVARRPNIDRLQRRMDRDNRKQYRSRRRALAAAALIARHVEKYGDDTVFTRKGRHTAGENS